MIAKLEKPFYHCLIHYLIKQGRRTDIISLQELKEEVRRRTTRNGGIPSKMVKYVIEEDFLKYGLIKRISRSHCKLMSSGREREIKIILTSYC